MSLICVDASLIVAWLLPETHSHRAAQAIETWQSRGDELTSPPMVNFETPSSIRLGVYTARISRAEGAAAFAAFLSAPIAIHNPPELLQQAWSIGEALNSPRLYDMYYLALAVIQDCEFWTVDERLYNLASHRYPLVRWIGDALP